MGQLVSDITDILENKKSDAENDGARRKILEQMASDEKTKTNLIKRALATQRAKYGAGGAATNTTGDAVLKRLRDETAAPYDDKKKTNLEKLKNIKKSDKNLLKSLLNRFDEMVG
jgi:hypothetical protein